MKGSNSYLVYDTQISLALPNIDHPITWSIQKRYTDFYELDQTLKVFLGIKYLPPLPGKKLNLDEKAQHDRKSGLEFYLILLGFRRIIWKSSSQYSRILVGVKALMGLML